MTGAVIFRCDLICEPHTDTHTSCKRIMNLDLSIVAKDREKNNNNKTKKKKGCLNVHTVARACGRRCQRK